MEAEPSEELQGAKRSHVSLAKTPVRMGTGQAGLSERSPTTDQIILHLDMDCFFVACERRREPSLIGEPVVIGGGFDADSPRGAVATASYEAREYGVHSAQPIAQALAQLPRRDPAADNPEPNTGIYLKGDHEYYRDVSEAVMEIVAEYSETRQQVSIDEVYLDLTATTSWAEVEGVVQELRDRIETEVGVVASVGVAPTKSCAKVASDYNKPDGSCIVHPGEVADFFAPLEIDVVHGVGPVTADRFRNAGIETAGELAALPPQEVVAKFGSNATTLHDRVRGIDPRPVEPRGDPKSISKEQSISPTTDMTTKESVVRQLADQVNRRVARQDARYRTVGIKVVATPFEVNTRERSLHGPVREPAIVEEFTQDLLTEFAETEVRKLGVRVSNLDFSPGDQRRLTGIDSQTTEEPRSPRQRLGQTRLTDFT